MRKLFIIAAFIGGLLASHAADVVFSFAGFDGVPVRNAVVFLTPRATGSANGVLVTADRKTYRTDSQGSFTASNLAAGSYQVEIGGTHQATRFNIAVPATNATLNAADLLIK